MGIPTRDLEGPSRRGLLFAGTEKSVYVPAGTVTEATTRSRSVTNVVAAFAPVRHTSP